MIHLSRPGRAALISVLLLSGALGLAGLAGGVFGWADIAWHAAPALAPLAAISALILSFSRRLAAPRAAKIVAFAGLACLVAPIGREVLGARAAERSWIAPSAEDTVIVSFNVGDLNADPGPVLQAILNSDADIVTLQEGLRPLHDGMPLLASAYPYRATCAQWWGCEIVILSRRPILSSGWMQAASEAPQRPWLVWARTAGRDGGSITVVSTHLAQILPPAPRAAQQEAVTALLRSLDERSLVLAGDLNATGSSHALMGFDRTMAPLTRRTRNLATWPDRFPGLAALRTIPVLGLDHIYASPVWSTVSISRLPTTSSDHRGVKVRLARVGGGQDES